MKAFRILPTLGMSFVAAASAVAQYDFDLILRSGDAGGYNLGDAFSFSSYTPVVNDSGQVAIKALALNGQFGIWTGTASAGSGIFAPVTGEPIGDASINNAGRVVFTRSDASGIFQMQFGSSSSSLLSSGPAGSSSVGSLRMLDNGIVGLRSNALGASYHLYNPTTNSYATPVTQTDNYTFLFSSVQFNQAMQFAAPVQITGGGTQIRRWNSDGSSVVIAENQTANASSSYTGFFNNIGFSDNGWVAYNAALAGGGRAIFLSNGVETREIANTNNGATDWGTGESFNMGVTNSGLVYFRGRDRQGRYALYVGDGSSLSTVVRQGDILQTDLGPAMIAWPGNTSPAFSANPTMNSLGQIVFAASLVNPTNPGQQYGLGVFSATPVPEPGTIVVLGLGALSALKRRRRR